MFFAGGTQPLFRKVRAHQLRPYKKTIADYLEKLLANFWRLNIFMHINFQGADLIYKRFGLWPSFHDAEVKSVAISVSSDAKCRPNLEMCLFYWGHELEDGTIGQPHFQTEGEHGHTFWKRGGPTGGLLPFLFDMLDPFGPVSGGEAH